MQNVGALARAFHNQGMQRSTLLVPVVMLCGLASGLPRARAEAEEDHHPLPDGYLVAPFENRSPVAALDWMSSALATTVAEKLEVHPALRPVYSAEILEGFPLAFDAAAVAGRASDRGARWVFAGSFARPNWKAEVTVRLYEVVGEKELRQVAEVTERGEREQLFELLDRCLVGVLDKKGFATQGEALAGLRRRPTKDLYALTLYGRVLNQYYGLKGPADVAGAEKLLRRVLFIDPNFAEAHRMLGVILLSRGEPGKAAGQYAHALDLRPGYYGALVALAHLYRAENRRQPAAELAVRALEQRPYDAEMRYLLGTLEWEGGELDKALKDLLRVTSEHPHHLLAHRALVQVYASKGNIEALAEELEQVVALAPDDIDVRLDLGAALMRLAKYQEASLVFEEVLKRKPKNAQALKLSGDLYRRMGDPERAIATYERMRRVNPEDPRPYFLLSAAYVDAGNDAKAEAVLQDAAGQFHRYLGEVWIDLGALALRRGEYGRATALLEKAISRAPYRSKAHFNYALLLNATNQRDKALAELRSAAELDPEDPDIPYLAGVIYLRLGRLGEAKTEFVEALRIRPSHADAQHNLTLLEDLEKRYDSERAGTGAQ
jgi:tetratricopeptide (TPR) repeat protein